jgi:hypothetical protein
MSIVLDPVTFVTFQLLLVVHIFHGFALVGPTTFFHF